MTAPKRLGELICGCYYSKNVGIVMCKVHKAGPRALNLVRMFRSYFADMALEQNVDPATTPFVKTIDEMYEEYGVGQ